MNALTVPLLLLLAVPVAPVLDYALGAPPLWVFVTGAIGTAVLADWIRRATDQLAERLGPAAGGLLSISFGSLCEIILAGFVLATGQLDVVRAQFTGSIIGTALLGLGLAVTAGGATCKVQTFRRENAGRLTSLMMLAMIALLLPAIFDETSRTLSNHGELQVSERALSVGAAAVLILVYAANVVYTLVTRRDIFAPDEPKDGAENAWRLLISLAVLAAATAAVAVESELVSSALGAAADSLQLSATFLGVIVLALVGTASDLFAAVFFARQDKMGLVMNICVGSAIQVALVVAPVLVLVSPWLGHPLTLVFSSPLDLFAIAAATFAVTTIAADGETNWFEGVLLMGVYALLGLAFFYITS